MNDVEAILLIGLATIIVAVITILSQRKMSRRASTLDYLVRVDTDRDILDARKTFSAVTSNYSEILKYAQKDQYHSKIATKIRLILNENEKIAIGIQFGALDGRYIRRTLRGSLINDFRVAAPYIYELRQLTSNPAIYHEFEELVRVLSGNKMPRRMHWWKFWN